MTAPKEEKQQPPQSSGDTGGSDGGKLTAGTLRAWMKEEIKALIPGTSGTKSTVDSGQQPQGDIKSEVASALEQLKAKEDRKNRDARVDKMLEEFEKPKEEVVPKESRRVEKFMRWGE